MSDWKPYLQQYTKIIKTPTLQTYFSYIFIKIEAYTKPNDVWSLRFKLEVFIWRHVVNVLKMSTKFRRILICVIFFVKNGRNRFLHSSLLKIWDFFHSCEKFYVFSLVPLHSTREKTEFLTLVKEIPDLQWRLVQEPIILLQ